jgi:hypothetical protein
MSRFTVVLTLASLAAAGLVQADTLSLAQIKSRNGILLSAEQLQKLLPGAKVVNQARNGSTRTWTNAPGGSMMISTDAPGRGGTRYLRSAEGSWRIDHDAYCVRIQWPSRGEEHWCRQIYKVGDKYYGVGMTASEDAPATEFEFSK